jgi:hypothetical protein
LPGNSTLRAPALPSTHLRYSAALSATALCRAHHKQTHCCCVGGIIQVAGAAVPDFKQPSKAVSVPSSAAYSSGLLLQAERRSILQARCCTLRDMAFCRLGAAG